MGKPYKLLETREDGTEVRLYENGDKRNQNGQLLEYNGKGNELITPETTRDYAKLRKQKILDAIEAELQSVTRTNVPAEAIGKIVGKRAKVAMDDEGRAGNEAAKIVLSAVDAYQEKQTNAVSTTRHEYAMDDETKALLHEMLRQRRDSIDANATDVESDDYTK